MCDNLMAMEFPERRQTKRLKTSLPVNFEHLGSSRIFGESTTKDISLTGLRMNMDDFFPSNSTFLLKLRFPEVNKVVEGIARVVWSTRASYSDQYQAGMEFLEMNPVFKKWLEEYILINETLGKKL